jgi:hypothetical protein
MVPGGGRIAFVAATNGYPIAADANTLTIAFKELGPFNMVKSRDLTKVIAAAVAHVIGREFAIEVIHDPTTHLHHMAPMSDEDPESLEPKPLSEGQKAIAKAKEIAEQPVVEVEEDQPHQDDPVIDEVAGAELLAKKLGGKIIEEYETDSKK